MTIMDCRPFLAVGVSFLAAVLISFVLGLAAILLGRWLGDKLMRGLQIEVSWISGLMLLVLAGLKLV